MGYRVRVAANRFVPHMTIAENVAVVPEMRKWSKEK